MIYAILVIVLLLLLAAGILAYQNSKLIAKRKMNESSSPSTTHMYTVINQSISGEVEGPIAVPLFQFTVFAESDGSTLGSPADSTFMLCKVAVGKGEMVLNDAENLMLKYIKHAGDQGALMKYQSFLHRETDHAEKELIMNLEDAVQGKGRMEC